MHLDGQELHSIPVAPSLLERELWDITSRLADDLIENWLPSERLVIGLAGSPPRAFMRKLLDRADSVVLCAGHYSDDHPRLFTGTDRQVDVLFTVNTSASNDNNLAPGGLHVALHSGDDLFETLRKVLLRCEPHITSDGQRLELQNGEGRISYTRRSTTADTTQEMPPIHIIGTLEGIASESPEADDWVIARSTWTAEQSALDQILSRIEIVKSASQSTPKRLWLVTNDKDVDVSMSAIAKVLTNEGLETRTISEDALLDDLPNALERIDEISRTSVNGALTAARRHSGHGVGGIPYTIHEMTIEKMIVINA